MKSLILLSSRIRPAAITKVVTTTLVITDGVVNDPSQSDSRKTKRNKTASSCSSSQGSVLLLKPKEKVIPKAAPFGNDHFHTAALEPRKAVIILVWGFQHRIELTCHDDSHSKLT